MAHTRTPRHPGRILAEDYLARLGGITQAEVADALRMSRPRLNELLNGVRGVTPDTALRLAKGFGTTPEYWLEAQAAWDLYQVTRARKRMRELEWIVPFTERLGGDPPCALSDPAGSPDLRTEIGVLAANVTSATASPSVEHYEDFLSRKGLLKEARRFVKIRAQLDMIGPDGSEPRQVPPGRVPALAFSAPLPTFSD